MFIVNLDWSLRSWNFISLTKMKMLSVIVVVRPEKLTKDFFFFSCSILDHNPLLYSNAKMKRHGACSRNSAPPHPLMTWKLWTWSVFLLRFSIHFILLEGCLIKHKNIRGQVFTMESIQLNYKLNQKWRYVFHFTLLLILVVVCLFICVFFYIE